MFKLRHTLAEIRRERQTAKQFAQRGDYATANAVRNGVYRKITALVIVLGAIAGAVLALITLL
jgi:hypothetical protein